MLRNSRLCSRSMVVSSAGWGSVPTSRRFGFFGERSYPPLASVSVSYVGCSADDKLAPQATHARRPGLYTKHGLALSFLVEPAFALGGRPGS